MKQDIVHQTYTLGTLEITFHMERIHGAITRQDVHNSLLLLFLGVVILVSAVFANRWIVARPLGRLLRAIWLAEESGSRSPVEWQSRDEIGELITAFNAMQAKLGADERNLRISETRLVDAQRIAKLAPIIHDGHRISAGRAVATGLTAIFETDCRRGWRLLFGARPAAPAAWFRALGR